MNPTAIGGLVLTCTFGGALAGMWLRGMLPPQHLDAESSGTVKVGIGLIATMTALVLGLVIGSAKTSFDVTNKAVRDTATDVLTLDRTLARYGPETNDTRALVRSLLKDRVDEVWPADGGAPQLEVPNLRSAETVASMIQALAPQTDEQRWLRGRATILMENVLAARWLVSSSGGTTVLGPFIAALLFWLSVTFVSFGLFAPRNFTVLSTLFVCSLSVASAVFLILEMDGPFEGALRVSPQPLRYALEQMNR